MSDISTRIAKCCSQIRECEKLNNLKTDSVRLLAVSKTQPAEAIREAYAAGIDCFGENYLQEAEQKINALSDLPIEWHFIGHIQSNKTKVIAQYFDWVHSVDRAKIAQRLDAQRLDSQTPLNVCIQVNISQEAQKAGALPEAVPELAAAIVSCSHLRLRGLMAIPAPDDTPRAFAAMRDLQVMLRSQGYDCDTLSMGMSGDYQQAIAHGANLIRLGTALFGPRRQTA